LTLYDILVETNSSPVVALNRAVAISRVRGPEAGLKAVELISDRKTLDSYYLLHAVVAQFQFDLGNFGEAAKHFQRAQTLAGVRSEQEFLANRLRSCREQLADGTADSQRPGLLKTRHGPRTRPSARSDPRT